MKNPARLFLAGMVVFFSVIALLRPASALTADEIARLTEAGVDEATIRSLEENEGLKIVEIVKPDGRKERIYFSTSTPEEEIQGRTEEEEKSRNSWDMLKNIIIDKTRSHQRPR